MGWSRANCHHIPVKWARKSKSPPLVIYDAHRSQIPPTGRWVQIIICWKVAKIEMSSAMARNLKGYQTKTRLTVTKNWKSMKVIWNLTQIPKSWWAALKRQIFQRTQNWILMVRDLEIVSEEMLGGRERRNIRLSTLEDWKIACVSPKKNQPPTMWSGARELDVQCGTVWVSELTFCQDFNVKFTCIFLLNHFSIT